MKKPVKMSKPYPIRIEETLYLKLQKISSLESRSMNKQIELVLKTFVSNYEIEHGTVTVNADDLYE